MAMTRAAIDEQIPAAMAANVRHGHRRECFDLADQKAATRPLCVTVPSRKSLVRFFGLIEAGQNIG
jgi:hypothetical protein